MSASMVLPIFLKLDKNMHLVAAIKNLSSADNVNTNSVFVVTHTSDCGMKHSAPIFVNVNCVEKFAAGKKC